jgi:hypothetical protein
MGKKKAIPTYVAHIEATEDGYRTVITRDGEQVYQGAVRRTRKAARMDAAMFVVQSPENERNLQWDDPFQDEPDEPADDQEGSQGRERPGLDLNETRTWLQSHPRIKDAERRVIFAAMDCFEALKGKKDVARNQLEPVLAATRCPRPAAWEIGGRLLAALGEKHPAAQEAFRELMASRKADERFQAVLSLSGRLPGSLLQDLLGQALTDRSKRIRSRAAYMSDVLQLREMVPGMLRQAEVERDADVKRDLEFHAAMIQDGYMVESKEGDGLTLHIRLRDGWTWQDIKQSDVDRGRVPAIVAKRRAERW